MTQILASRKYFLLIALAAIGLFSFPMRQNTHASTLTKLQTHLPREISGWQAVPKDRIFDQKTIFSYINGGAEVYQAYDMQGCLSRRYQVSGGPAIMLDIFDMGSPENAFGVFTHDTGGKIIPVGQDGRLRPGWVCFWKYRFFVSVYAEDDTPAAQKAITVLAEQVAGVIEGRGAKPDLLSRLPAAGLQSDKIRYLHHPVLLNYHYFISDENILQISANTDVTLASYRIGHQRAILMLVQYTKSRKAEESRGRFLKFYLPDADRSGMALMENGKWAAVRGRNQLLAVVLEADSRKLAENLLRKVKWP
jgi:hypothetical protein